MATFAVTFDTLISRLMYIKADSIEEADKKANKIIYKIQNASPTDKINLDDQQVKVETKLVEIVGTTFIDPEDE